MRIDALIEWNDAPAGHEKMEVTFEDSGGSDDLEDDDDVFFYGTPVVSDEFNFDGWRVLEVYS